MAVGSPTLAIASFSIKLLILGSRKIWFYKNIESYKLHDRDHGNLQHEAAITTEKP